MTERRRNESRQAQYESKAYSFLVDRLAMNVRSLREMRGWSQLETSQNCGMALYQYQRVEGGLTNVTFTTLARLMEGFGVEIIELFEAPRGAKNFSTSRTRTRGT